MNCLVIGASSYIAQAFVSKYKDQLNIKEIRRSSELKNYFDLESRSFYNIDVVINFTGIVHQKNPDKKLSYEINTRLPAYLAKQAKSAGVKQFIHMSTIAVYDQMITKIKSNSNTYPLTIYGRTKLEGDNKLIKIADTDFAISIIRPPLVYGMDAPGNMNKLITLIKKGWPLPFAYTKNKRSILYIDNLNTAIYRIIEQKASGIYILCDKEAPSLFALCNEINKHVERKSLFFSLPNFLIEYLISFKSSPFNKLYGDFELDDSQTQNQIGNYAYVELSDAIEKTVKDNLC